MSDVVVQDRPGLQRYEASLDGDPAGYLAYETEGDVVTLTHTEVPPRLEGRGVGSALARRALDDARAAGRRVVPACPFVAAWIARHPDYAPLVVGDGGK